MVNQFKQPVANYNVIDYKWPKNVVFTIGISASGKSTWAEQQEVRDDVVIIERDRIRKYVFQSSFNRPFEWRRWNWSYEPQVNTIQQILIGNAIQSFNIKMIVISDTNVKANAINDVIEFCHSKNNEIQYYYKLFDVELDIAKQRDKERQFWVGDSVLEKQYQSLIQLKKDFKITS